MLPSPRIISPVAADTYHTLVTHARSVMIRAFNMIVGTNTPGGIIYDARAMFAATSCNRTRYLFDGSCNLDSQVNKP